MIIDVHGHVTPPALLKRFPMPPSLGDVAGMIEQKAALGIDLTIVGSPVGAGTMVPMPGLDNYAQPADELESFHDWVGETVREHHEHLRGYVYVNPLDEDLVERAAKRLAQQEFVGLIANTSVRGTYLNDPRADQFFALAAETGAPVLLHPPAEPVGSAPMNGHLGLIEHVTRPCDITCGIAAILFAGWLDKYPSLKLIAANAGGALSLLREKLDLAQHRAKPGPPGPPAPVTDPASGWLRRIHVDTATPSALALSAAAEVFGTDRLLFGTDSPPLTAPLQSGVDMVRALPDERLIFAENARRLFGLEGS